MSAPRSVWTMIWPIGVGLMTTSTAFAIGKEVGHDKARDRWCKERRRLEKEKEFNRLKNDVIALKQKH